MRAIAASIVAVSIAARQSTVSSGAQRRRELEASVSDQKRSQGSSPASTGPAGPQFEAQVGAHYLLTLLTNAEPRGLPGATIERIELQRAGEGYPLDDIVIHARDAVDRTAVLEIQVKRDITFAPNDTVFEDVVRQIARASERQGFIKTNHQLAIATAKISRKIAGPYQDVLKWARDLESSATFFERLGRHGAANDDMRSFVRTFRIRLAESGVTIDDDSVWNLLRRLQILVFDFTAEGSASAELARERALHALHEKDASDAGKLWAALIERAIALAATGGARTRSELQQELRTMGFSLAGDRRHGPARRALAEASARTLEHIDDRIGQVTLVRSERLAAVRTALDRGRFVEIRGDAGVGKSGLLKHFALQLRFEVRTIAVSPGHITPGGWSAMRSVLDFDGTVNEFLADIAAAGAAVLFIDNLDFFEDDERRTVIDLVDAVARVPGFSVVVTARRRFEDETVNWLPGEALDRLGRAEPVTVDELSASEVAALQKEAPQVAGLLAESHPAREVARNLYRLGRLLHLTGTGGDARTLRTEIDMAEQWWKSADGPNDSLHRPRARLLRFMADRLLLSTRPVDVSSQPAEAVDALISSETLRELHPDEVAFRHDVLAEWAIGLFLSSEPATIDRLPLSEPAPPRLARAVELAARIALERSADSAQWEALLTRLSGAQIHRSWRRAVLLAVVRSETGKTLLARTSAPLSTNDASLLKELIRTVMAVDVTPISDLLAGAGVEHVKLGASFNVPSGPSWLRLIAWLLDLGEKVPIHAIADVVELYTEWSIGHFGNDALTPALLPWLYRWLSEIEDARALEDRWNPKPPFGGQVHGLDTLESNLRTGFLLFCDKTPALASDYLRSVMRRPHNAEIVRSILKFRGALAKAAPGELADLTVSALVPNPENARTDRDHPFRGAFGHVDLQFIPASPAQGPFLELLIHAPDHGLRLIRRLVDAAITFYTGGRENRGDGFLVVLPEGERIFPWVRSYNWSREGADVPSSVESSLLALEAWSHKRIENGEPIESVLQDVLGTVGAPACYLLVAVDLVLSHWPASAQSAVSLLGCPELLCIDRQRQVHDKLVFPDIFGLKELQKEPIGAATLTSLTSRPSRRVALEELLPHYAFQPPALRDELARLLNKAAERLGPPGPDASRGDPPLMATHALNLIDPKNYREEAREREDGTLAKGFRYVPPEAERRHFERLQELARPRSETTAMQMALSAALEDRSQSSPELAAAAVKWAQSIPAPQKEDQEAWLQDQSVLIAAMIAMRDGDDDLRAKTYDWAHTAFAGALSGEDDPVHQSRKGIRFNPVAIAFVGLVHALKDRRGISELPFLLEASVKPAAVHGFIAESPALANLDERLPRAILRCALASCVYRVRQWDDRQSEDGNQIIEQRKTAAIEAELGWLAGSSAEPSWPTPPFEHAVSKRRPIIGRAASRPNQEQSAKEPELRFNDQLAALWVQAAKPFVSSPRPLWVFDLVRAFADWTWTANGASLDRNEEVSNPPREWNIAYFDLFAQCLSGLTESQVDGLVLDPLRALPDDSFLETTPPFLRGVDSVYFNDRTLGESIAVHIRSTITQHLLTTNSWKWLERRRDSSIGMSIAPIVATCFFNDYGHGLTSTKAYLFPKGIPRVAGFLPALAPLVASARCHFVAAVTLNLLEVAPDAEHLSFLAAGATTWLSAYPDSRDFWIDHAFGKRVCGLIENAWKTKPDALSTSDPIRQKVNDLLASLVQIGVPEAARLERALLT